MSNRFVLDNRRAVFMFSAGVYVCEYDGCNILLVNVLLLLFLFCDLCVCVCFVYVNHVLLMRVECK